MHWWHGAHFPLWGRGELLAKSLDWYLSVLPIAKELANEQGYEGARWPKQVGIDGKQSPSPIAPLLIWQQPHPISLAELCYRFNPNMETLKRWKEIVVETANFMVSYAVWNKQKRAYTLGPPFISFAGMSCAGKIRKYPPLFFKLINCKSPNYVDKNMNHVTSNFGIFQIAGTVASIA